MARNETRRHKASQETPQIIDYISATSPLVLCADSASEQIRRHLDRQGRLLLDLALGFRV
jgi:hypothetical protein